MKINSQIQFIKFLKNIPIHLVLFAFLYFITNQTIESDCRLCPEISPVKILLKNGVIRKGHIAVNPEEELSVKPDRSLEVIRRSVKLRLYLSLDSKLDLNSLMPHLIYDQVYMDILYKDIAKIELLENLDK